jgi:pimeloyl-ACP methyl ester carboxylesterase
LRSSETLGFASLGLPLVARAWGPPEAPVVVCLHGFLDTGFAFAEVAAPLSDRWRVVAPDHRGHGLSGRVGAGGYYHFPDYVLDLDGLFRALGRERIALVGHSMGATIAAYFAGAFPERVSAVAFLDGVGPPAPAAPPPDLPGRLRGWIDDVREAEAKPSRSDADLDAIADRIARHSPRAPREAASEPVAAATGRRFRFDPLHRTRAPLPFDPERIASFLPRIACPALVLWAETSPMRTPDVEARLALLPRAEVETVPGTGHNLHHERPDEVARRLSVFLERSGARAGAR